MHECLKEDNMHRGVAPKKMRLFHDCILQGIQRKAEMEFGRNSADHNKVLENWNAYFCVRCREECSFFYLAYDSLHCAEEMIKSIHASNCAVFNGDSAQFNTVPDVVPESLTPRTLSTYAGESTHE